MPERLEREIKLSYASAAEARARLLGLGAALLRPRRLQDDALFDTGDGSLKSRNSALRIRVEDGTAHLTFKGAPLPSTMKVREELEVGVDNAELLRLILERLGFRPWFRYQKYREEYALDGLLAAVDETPIGTFVELEGDEARIARVAEALGMTPSDYIVDSYRRLFERHRAAHALASPHMLFSDR